MSCSFTKVIIIGSGGHSKVIKDIFESSSNYEIIRCTLEDINCEKITGISEKEHGSNLQRLYDEGIRDVFVAIGDNKLRAKIGDYVQEMGFKLVNAISNFTCISPTAKFGKGVAIMPGAVINADVVIEDNVIINTGVTIDHDCLIGESSHIAPGCNLSGKVQVGHGVFLGTGCRVIDKISIGEWTIVGAGAAVVKDLPGYCTAVGVPAKVIKNLK